MIRLLLLDDDDGVRGALSILLEFDGYVIRSARSTLEARAIVANERIDAVVTDAHIPGDDVVAFTEWLNEVHPEIHVIVCSGAYDAAVDAVAAHADARVGKYEGMGAISSAVRHVVGVAS